MTKKSKQQLSLFDICAKKHKGNLESRAANLKIHKSKEAVRAKLYLLAQRQGRHGIIADEVAAAWNCTHNHVAPRISELRAAGKLVPTEDRRPTRTGCSARVLVADQYLDEGPSRDATFGG